MVITRSGDDLQDGSDSQSAKLRARLFYYCSPPGWTQKVVLSSNDRKYVFYLDVFKIDSSKLLRWMGYFKSLSFLQPSIHFINKASLKVRFKSTLYFSNFSCNTLHSRVIDIFSKITSLFCDKQHGHMKAKTFCARIFLRLRIVRSIPVKIFVTS